MTLTLVDIWPLFGLSLHTPDLDLRIIRDEDLPGLVAAAERGIHTADFVPFASNWALKPLQELRENSARNDWGKRAAFSAQKWNLAFAIHHRGTIIGQQNLRGVDPVTTRSVGSGSWLSGEYQGRGLGTQARIAVVLFGLDYLGLTELTSGAWGPNRASHAVSRKVGYLPNGIARHAPGTGHDGTEYRYRVTADTVRRPKWELRVEGFTDALRRQLGIA